MHERLQKRLGELKHEFERGRTRLQELEKEQMQLRETMLRISGAVQVLEELLSEEQAVTQKGTGLDETQSMTDQVAPGQLAGDQNLSQNGAVVHISREKE